MPARILTMFEFRVLYKLGERAARKMLQSGQIYGLRTPAGWRIVDPGPTLLELTRRQALPLAEIPLIRGCEAAVLMGVSERRVRRVAELGKLDSEMRGHRRVYSLASIEKYMAQRNRGNRRLNHNDQRDWVRLWAARNLAQTLREQGEVVPVFLERQCSQNADKSTG